ncbi:hypothetical protein BC833DRAFT_585573 [Globomyces pollinis-pini]|nr:hypothetical protein BC833DRAFT_585573 [Globomyces pollinis-pini]
MTFGEDLWDQIKVVESFTSLGTDQMLLMNEFIKSLATVELEYGKTLSKVAKQFKDDSKKLKDKGEKSMSHKLFGDSVLMKASESLVAGVESLSTIHNELNEILTNERKSLKHNAKQLEQLNIQLFERLKQSTNELHTKIDIMEKCHGLYNKEMKELEISAGLYKKSLKDSNTTKKESEKHRIDYEKKLMLAQDTGLKYRKSINETNKLKSIHFTQLVPKTLDEIQSQDEKFRVEYTRDTLIRITNAIISSLPKEISSWQDISERFVSIDGGIDSKSLCEKGKSGYESPEDFSFSDTIDEHNRKVAMKGRMPVNGVSDDPDELIMMSKTKAGRKKAVERIKALEKEITEVAKERQGIETLLMSYKDLSNPLDAKEELTEQRTETESHMNALLIKKHKFHCFINELDGKPKPPEPAMVSSSPVKNFLSPSLDISHLSHAKDYSSAMSVNNELGHSKDYSSALSVNHEKGHSKDYSSNLSINNNTQTDSFEKLPSLGRYVALFDFQAVPGGQELALRAGDLIDILSEESDGWTHCRLVLTDQEGFVPSSYIGPVS